MSSMADFAGALGGGGAPPPDTGTPAPPPEPTATPDQGSQSFGSPAEALDAAEQALQAYIQMEPDHADRLTATKVLAQVTGLKATDAQQMGQTANLGGLAQALAGPGGGPGGPPGPGGGGY